VELSPLIAELSPLVIELSLLLAELSLLVTELSSLVAELSPLLVELSLLVARRRALAARTAPPAMLGDWSGKHILSQTTEHDILLDHPTSVSPRPPDQRSGTSSSTTRPAFGDCAFDHSTNARGFVDRVSCYARGLL
jgi:hypothetical protein